MKTPSMVSADRILLRASAWNAADTIIKAKARTVPALPTMAVAGCRRLDGEPAGNTPVNAPGGALTAGFRSSDITCSVPHGDDPAGIGRDIGFMRHDNDRDAALAVERLKRLHDLV